MPHWSLDNIYPSVDSDEFRNDLARVAELSAKLERDCLLSDYDELSAIAINLDAYVNALLSVDSANRDTRSLGMIIFAFVTVLELSLLNPMLLEWTTI